MAAGEHRRRSGAGHPCRRRVAARTPQRGACRACLRRPTPRRGRCIRPPSQTLTRLAARRRWELAPSTPSQSLLQQRHGRPQQRKGLPWLDENTSWTMHHPMENITRPDDDGTDTRNTPGPHPNFCHHTRGVRTCVARPSVKCNHPRWPSYRAMGS